MFLTRWNIPLLCKFFSASLTNLSYRLIALRIIKLQFFTVSYQLMERNIKLLLIPQLCRFKPVNNIVFLISNSYSKEKKLLNFNTDDILLHRKVDKFSMVIINSLELHNYSFKLRKNCNCLKEWHPTLESSRNGEGLCIENKQKAKVHLFLNFAALV